MLGAFVKFEMDKLPVLCAFTENSSPEIAFVLRNVPDKKRKPCVKRLQSVEEEHSDTKRQSKRSHADNVHSVVMMLFYIVHTDKYTHTIFFKLSVEDWGYRS